MDYSQKPYRSVDGELKKAYGGKVYKLSLQSGCSCPNRDGSIGKRGCIFCSEGGSGEFAADAGLCVTAQIEAAKKKIEKKAGKDPAGYIAYFQSFSNTYGDTEKLEKMFREAIENPEILILSIATRPDCIKDDMYELLSELNKIKPVWVELGLQTIHDETAKLIRRGYGLSAFEEAAGRLKAAGITVITHAILGLPGESREMMTETALYLADLKDENGSPLVDGLKLHLLHILKGTDLFELYEDYINKICAGGESAPLEWVFFTLNEYVDFVIDILEALPPETVIHRITGDAPKRLLAAPLWSADKKRVLNAFSRRFAERKSFQGKRYKERLRR